MPHLAANAHKSEIKMLINGICLKIQNKFKIGL